VEHFLLECPEFWKERYDLRNKVGAGNMKLGFLLGDGAGVKETVRYVMETKRLENV
jgi:hypothetical protein